MTILAALVLLAQAVDLDAIRVRADALLEEAKSGYESARTSSSVPGFIEAGFKLEEARIKYLVLMEVGTAELQKTASDRLRAVNQLNKLINDGRVAIQKPPPAPEAAPAPPGPDALPPPVPPAPAAPPPAVTARAAVPGVDRQKETEKLIKEVFKDRYAKKSPDDQRALSRALLEQANKSADDPAGLWVLLREARDIAAQICDVPLIVASSERTARMFDVDGLAILSASLLAAGKVAKSPAEIAALADALLRLVDDHAAVDQYEAAEKAVSAAQQHAKKSNDAALIKRSTARAKEVAEAKSKFQGLKKVLETLAKNPDDPAANGEFGQFHCFVKSNWDLGLRFLAKGSDAALRGLAEREMASSPEAAGDGWFEHVQTEKSALRKSQIYEHIRELYQRALPRVSALERLRIEKRLAQLPSEGVDSGLVAWWRFDEKAGLVAKDATGRGSLVLSNGAAWTPGAVGGALSLDGKGARATAEDANLMNIDGLAFTVACFVKLGGRETYRLVTKLDVGVTPSRGWVIDANTGMNAAGQATHVPGGIRLRLADAAGQIDYAFDAGLAIGGWKHVAVTVDLKGDGVKFYVDGETSGPARGVGTPPGSLVSNAPLCVGWMSNVTKDPKYLNGAVDELRLYRRALSAPEIKELSLRK